MLLLFYSHSPTLQYNIIYFFLLLKATPSVYAKQCSGHKGSSQKSKNFAWTSNTSKLEIFISHMPVNFTFILNFDNYLAEIIHLNDMLWPKARPLEQSKRLIHILLYLFCVQFLINASTQMNVFAFCMWWTWSRHFHRSFIALIYLIPYVSMTVASEIIYSFCCMVYVCYWLLYILSYLSFVRHLMMPDVHFACIIIIIHSSTVR